MKTRCLFLSLFVLLMVSKNVTAQRDSVVNTDSLVKAFFKTSESKKYNRADFTQSIEKAYEILDGAKTLSSLSWKELAAKQQLIDNRKILRVLRKVLKRHTNSDFRNLQLYRNMERNHPHFPPEHYDHYVGYHYS
jgi:hypothetical protein